MCLIVLAYRQHPSYRLVFAANRDEFYARPTASMAWWRGTPAILAGRDLAAGGTWFGITHGGRFAAVTNYREPRAMVANAPSRGLLVPEFLRDRRTPRAYIEDLRERAQRYNGFSLLAGDRDTICYFCNRERAVRDLQHGLYGLSNHLLDTPWPKVAQAKSRLAQLLGTQIAAEDLFNLLMNQEKPADKDLPATGVELQWERVLAPIFIASPDYGTRSSTALLISHAGQVFVTERAYPGGDTRSYRWRIRE